MELIIRNDDKLELSDFCSYLIDEMRNYLISQVDLKRLIPIDFYLNSEDSPISFSGESREISSYKILVDSVDYLEITEINDDYKISLNANATIYGTYNTYDSIIRLINFGNLMVFPYDIYDQMMNFFANNLESYYNVYVEETI